ncbi:MAG: SpoIIE family protein phosphatase [Bryobacteraceae bacterium]
MNEKLLFSFLDAHYFSPKALEILKRAQDLVRLGEFAGQPIGGMVNRVNAALCGEGPGTPIALLCARFDFATSDFTYVAAGQFALLITGDGSVRTLDAGGRCLGETRDYTFFEGIEHLEPGDTLIVYNDPFSRELDADTVVEIVRPLVREHRQAAAIRDAVAREWSRTTRGRCDFNSAASLIFTPSVRPSGAMMFCGLPSFWEAEQKVLGSLHRRPYWAKDYCYPVVSGGLKAA